MQKNILKYKKLNLAVYINLIIKYLILKNMYTYNEHMLKNIQLF